MKENDESTLSKDLLVPLIQAGDACSSRGGGVLPYMDYIGMCRCEGYGFQAVHSTVGYTNQIFWV